MPNTIQMPQNTQDINQISAPSKYVSNNIKKSDAVICCIALNEELYIDEWINYHLALGFSHIYIYDNSETNILKSKQSDKITVIHFPGPQKQLEAYDLFTISYKTKHIWAAFIDCDEFIVLKKHNNIIDFVEKYKDCNCIALNWIMFGTSNKMDYSNEPVLSRFRYCSRNINEHIKCIVQLAYIHCYISPHMPLLKSGIIYDTHKNTISEELYFYGKSDIACIHHYYTKSEEEFIKKINRGRADIAEKRSLNELKDLHNQNNEIYNSDAWDFYSKHCLS